jgi:putative aldouronate transport system permease protein
MKIKRTVGEIIFDVLNVIILTVLSITFIYPFLHVTVQSLSRPEIAALSGFKIFPKEIILESYKKVLTSRYVWSGYYNTIIVVLLGWAISLTLTISGAYPLSRRNLPNRTFWTLFIVFTMFFKGGLVPSYLLVKSLGLFNTYFAMILPVAVSTWNLIIMRNFFMGIPLELEEAAYLDGAGPFKTLISIILPISKPVIATISLWVIVGYWNRWFECLIYIQDTSKFVLQVVLRRIISAESTEMLQSIESAVGKYEDDHLTDSLTIRSATIIVATLPILVVYPFIQKYFVKGVMVGSLKG